MHDVPDIHAIRVMWQRGVSKREIARLLHLSRKTVDKYTDPEYVVPAQPRMQLAQSRAAPKLDRFRPIIQAWVEADEQAPRKQRRTARKIYQDLVAQEQADISEVSVRRYVAQLKGAREREAFVPLEFAMGEMAEGDFGHAVVVLGGREQRLPFFASRLMASGVSFVKMYPHEKLEAILDGMVSALSFAGGVPAKFMFDNTGILVQQMLAGGRRLLTPEFKALQAHYAFEAVFANLGRGNEKGGVENLVQWAQRNLFSPVPDAADLDALNEHLARKCLEDARRRHRPEHGPLVADLWEQEQGHLRPLPARPYPACRHRYVRVDKCLIVDYDNAHYSAPATYLRKTLLLGAFWDHVELSDGGRLVASHSRQQPGQSSLQLAHYLPVLERKPHAVSHAAVIARGEPTIARYRDEFLATRPDDYREMVAILRLSEQAGMARLTAALAKASTCHAYDLSSIQALLATDEPEQVPAALPEAYADRWPKVEVATVNCDAYAWLQQDAAGGVWQ